MTREQLLMNPGTWASLSAMDRLVRTTYSCDPRTAVNEPWHLGVAVGDGPAGEDQQLLEAEAGEEVDQQPPAARGCLGRRLDEGGHAPRPHLPGFLKPPYRPTRMKAMEAK